MGLGRPAEAEMHPRLPHAPSGADVVHVVRNRPAFDPKGYIWIADAEDLLGRSIYGQAWCPPSVLPTKWMLPPPGSEEAETDRAKAGALSYLLTRSFEDWSLVKSSRQGHQIPTPAADALQAAGLRLPKGWHEGKPEADDIVISGEVYRLAYMLDREVRLFWEMAERIRGSIVRNCEAGKILTFTRAETGGELAALQSHMWSMQYWDPRFDSGAMDLLNPFPRKPDYIEFHHDPVRKTWTRLHIGSEERDRATVGRRWIFVDEDSFARTYGAAGATEMGPAPTDPAGPGEEDACEAGEAKTSLPYSTLQEAVAAALKRDDRQRSNMNRRALEAIQGLGWNAWPAWSSKRTYSTIRGKMGLKNGEICDADTLRRMIRNYRLDEYRE